jgi:TatD DNase family protein
MTDFSDLTFVVHCFTGTPDECRQWIARDAYIGITGIVTYKNAADVREDARLVPADRLLVETDAPYLSPEPVRKIKINEPSHVAHVAKFVADLRGISYDALCDQTTTNAARFFGQRLIAPDDA